MMSGRVGDLSPKQAEILEKFRESVKDVTTPKHDDYFLTRWLRARDFDMKAAEQMLRNHFTWREQNQVDRILTDYQLPEVIKKYYPGGFCGRDKEGSPVWIDNFGDIDIKGMLASARKQEIIRSKIYVLEKLYKICEEESTEEKKVEGIVVIFDLEKLGMKHLWKPGVDLFCSILKMFEEQYPETLKLNFTINAPRIFPIAFNLTRPFLEEGTIRKVHVLGNNFKDQLLKYIDADQLPVHWGGSKTDPDGNTKCPSLICLGGEIPKEFYLEALCDLDSFTKVELGRGSSHQLDYEIKMKGSVIRWQFKTDGFDIGFGLFKRTKNKRQKATEMEEVVPSERVNSHLVPEDGSATCNDIGTYVVRFDNTYSWTRGKNLFYLIEVLEPDTTNDLDFVPESPSRESNYSFHSVQSTQ